MKARRTLNVMAVLFCFVLLALADERTDHSRMQIFMRQKLEYSRGITEGIVLEKFELISRNTAAMHNMSQSNFWIQTTNAAYASNVTNFQAQLTQLFLAAGDRDLDRTTAAYGKVLKSCIDCHHLVRKEQLGLPRWGVQEESEGAVDFATKP